MCESESANGSENESGLMKVQAGTKHCLAVKVKVKVNTTNEVKLK